MSANTVVSNSILVGSESRNFQGWISEATKPVSDLLGDKFEIKEFKDYVRVESLPSARSLVEAKEDEGGDEDDEEAVVLNSKDIMDQLRKGKK